MKHKTVFVAVSALLFLLSSTSRAAVSVEQAAHLGKDLTPIGAKKAGNAAGTIPAWNGGITEALAGFKTGGHHPDPYAGEKPLFRIDSSNVEQYAQQLTAGAQALIKAYPDYYMTVYPSHRSASVPPRIYQATEKNATTAHLVEGGNGVTGAQVGIPFPIPENGQQVIWNHLLRFRPVMAERHYLQIPVQRDGSYTAVKFLDQFLYAYGLPGATEASLNNVVFYFKQKVIAPPRLAGQVLLVHETLNQSREARKAWLYNPGQRRVRRAPNVAFDNPRTASDGLATSDQLDMFNGSLERYDWKLVGKKEMYVPYNSYPITSGALQYTQIVQPQHLNPQYLRYELHRVWVVEATLKKGARHIYKRRTFYFDEDSWQILAVDQYDNRDQLWRVSEGHVINYYETPTLWTVAEVHYDLQSGRYLVLGLNNEEPVTYDMSVTLQRRDFTPSALRRAGRR